MKTIIVTNDRTIVDATTHILNKNFIGAWHVVGDLSDATLKLQQQCGNLLCLIIDCRRIPHYDGKAALTALLARAQHNNPRLSTFYLCPRRYYTKYQTVLYRLYQCGPLRRLPDPHLINTDRSDWMYELFEDLVGSE